MTLARYKCECGKTIVIQFEAGKVPNKPICPECSLEMKRQFGNVSMGDVMPDEFVEISRMMTFHSKK